MVRRGDEDEQCARPRNRGLQEGETPRYRPFAQALGRGKQAAERHRLPVGDVDADLLCQPLGAGLSASRPKTLEGVKDELRRLFDKQKA
jgi:hypothetical protein